MHGMYALAHLADLDLDTRSQWVGKCKTKSSSNAVGDHEQAISIKLATTVDHCVRDLDFASVYIA